LAVLVIHKLSGQDTGGSFSIVEHPLQQGTLGAAPHTHLNEDEYSFVLEGEVGVQIGEQEFTATPGTYILKPRGIPHTFWNAGEQPARIIEIISPAGFEKYFDEIGEVISAADGGEPDFEKLAETAGRYGLTMHMERMPELMEKYNLRLG
jgi:quercetin dioxygenase-like cupin family protein